MDCLENEYVCSVKKENNQGFYRVHTIWNDSGFLVNIASRDGAWTGEMKPENVQSMSNELKLDCKTYLAECKEVLTSEGGEKGYFYSIENGSFIWKKLIDEDSGMKIRMGSVIIRPVSFVVTIQNILDVALNCNKNLKKQLNSLKQEKKIAMERICELQEKLDELCDKKNFMEIDLYSKFLILLNSKKRKIQELEDLQTNIKEVGKKSEKYGLECDEKNKLKRKSVIEAYEMDTEDEDEDKDRDKDDYRQKKYIEHEKSADSMNGQVSADSLMCEYNCISEKTINDQSTSQLLLENDEKCRECTSNLDNKVGNCSVPGTPKSSPDNFELLKVKNKSLPDTKVDILDFFFGPTGES